MNCNKCELCNEAKNPVILGVGSENARVMFIQDCPGALDDKHGKPFYGKSCNAVRKAMENRGIGDVYFTSLVKCIAPNEEPKPAHIEQCVKYLEAEIEVVDPDIIVPTGNKSLKYCIGRVGITKVRGNAQEVKIAGRTRIVLPTMHPRSVLKKPAYKEYILKDLDTLKDLYSNGMTDISGVNYKYLETVEDCVKEIVRLKNEARIISFDLETTGKSAYMDYSKIVCISLTDKTHYGVVIPLYKLDSPMNTQDTGFVVKLLRWLLEDESIPKVAHNGKFDIEWLRDWLNIDVKNFSFDTMLAHYLAVSEEQGTQGLKSQAWEFTDMGGYDNELDEYRSKLSDGEGVKSRYNYDRIPWEVLRKYAAADVDCCLRLMEIYKPMIDENPQWSIIMNDIMMPASYALRDIESNGMKFDATISQKYKSAYAEEIARITDRLESYPEVLDIEREKRQLFQERELIKSIPKKDRTDEEQKKFTEYKKYENFKFNWNSVKQLRELLYNKLGLVTSVMTDKGELSTSEEAMNELREQHEIPDLLLELRKVNTLNNMFIQKLPEMVDEHGIIHPSFNLTGCVVGDTLIPTSEGMYKISEIVGDIPANTCVDKVVKIVNLRGELENTSKIIKLSNRETVRVTTQLGFVLEGTTNHPIVVNMKNKKQVTHHKYTRQKALLPESRRWKQLQSVTELDLIAIPYGQNCYGNYILDIPAWEFSNYKNVSKIPRKLPSKMTEDLALLLGMYYANGHIKDENGSWCLEICSKDKDVIAEIGRISLQLFGLRVTNCDNSGTSFISISGINLRPLERILELKRGCLNKTIPQYILSAPKSIQAAYIKGMTIASRYFTDRNSHSLKIRCAREDVAKTLQLMLLNMGIVSICKQDSRTSHTFDVSVYNSEYCKFRDQIGCVQSKKMDYSYKVDETCRKRYIVDYEHHTLWLGVKSIEHSVDDVYDFTVPNTHSFVSNGFISHNTVTGRMSSENPNSQQYPRKSENPLAFQYHNEPKALFGSRFGSNGCIMNADYCLAGDTEVSLINGETDTIKNICDRVTKGELVYTYSINPGNEKIEVSRIIAGAKTKHNSETLVITLDNGKTVTCSDNHKFLLRTGKYAQAKDLRKGMSLMGFTEVEELDKASGVTYRSIGVNKNFVNLTKEHILIYRYFRSDYKEGVPIHHKDRNGLNNHINNLEQLTYSEHFRTHMLKFWNNLTPEERSEFTKLHVTSDTRKKLSIKSKKCWDSITEENYRAFCKKIANSCPDRTGSNNGMWGRTHSDSALKTMSEKRSAYNLSKPLEERKKTSIKMWEGRIIKNAKRAIDAGLPLNKETYTQMKLTYDSRVSGWEKAVPILLKYNLITNHKIISIRTGSKQDLYDIEVENNHNFPLGCGVFVHNCALEMRIAAVISKDENLTQALLSGKDLHKSTASLVWGVPVDEVPKDMRTRAKSVNFGIIYGKSGITFAKDLYYDPSGENPNKTNDWDKAKEEGLKLVDDYLNTFSGLKRWLERTKKLAYKRGYVETMFGRRRRLPDLHSKVPTLKSNAERQAINAPIQGTGTDLTVLSIIAINNWLKTNKMKSMLICTVHDSIVFDVYIPELLEVSAAVKQIMEHVHEPYIDTIVPIAIDLELGANYGATFDVTLEECANIHTAQDFKKWNHEKCLAKYKKEIATLHGKGWDYERVIDYLSKYHRPLKELVDALVEEYSEQSD